MERKRVLRSRQRLLSCRRFWSGYFELRARALEPHHPEATANLQIARDEARALEMQPSWLERYLQFASVNQYTITAAVAFWIVVLCLAALIFARRRSAAMVA